MRASGEAPVNANNSAVRGASGAPLLSHSQCDADLPLCSMLRSSSKPDGVPPLKLDNLSVLLEEANLVRKREKAEAAQAKLKKEEEARQKAEKAKEQAYREAKERSEAHVREMGIAPVLDSDAGAQAMRESVQAQLQMLTALCNRPSSRAASGCNGLSGVRARRPPSRAAAT